MFRSTKVIVAASAAAVSLWAVPTAANVSGTIYLRAHVPVYCSIDLFPASAQARGGNVVHLGTSQELCNAPRGYRVVLDHPAHLPEAAVLSDGVRIPLTEIGETVLWDSDHPGFERRQLELDLGDEPAPVSRLGLRIEVKY